MIINQSFFIKKNNVIDLIAGGFCSKIKLTSLYFLKSFRELYDEFSKFINLLEQLKNLDINLDFLTSDSELLTLPINQFKSEEDKRYAFTKIEDINTLVSLHSKINLSPSRGILISRIEQLFTEELGSLIKNLMIGFDEILLLHLFKSFISCDIKLSDGRSSYIVETKEQFDMINNTIANIEIVPDEDNKTYSRGDTFLYKKDESVVDIGVIHNITFPKVTISENQYCNKDKCDTLLHLLNVPFPSDVPPPFDAWGED